MKLAKPHVDVGLFARSIERHQAFWSDRVGLPYDHRLKLGAGIHQHRFHLNGSVLKVNHARSRWRNRALQASPVCESPALTQPRRCDFPTLTATASRWCRRDTTGSPASASNCASTTATHINASGGMSCSSRRRHPTSTVCGDTRIFVCEEASVERTQSWRGYGWRYLTVQVTDCQAEHDGVLARGGDEGEPPRRLGDVAVVSFVRDPDGNFIELSQRASLVGPL